MPPWITRLSVRDRVQRLEGNNMPATVTTPSRGFRSFRSTSAMAATPPSTPAVSARSASTGNSRTQLPPHRNRQSPPVAPSRSSSPEDGYLPSPPAPMEAEIGPSTPVVFSSARSASAEHYQSFGPPPRNRPVPPMAATRPSTPEEVSPTRPASTGFSPTVLMPPFPAPQTAATHPPTAAVIPPARPASTPNPQTSAAPPGALRLLTQRLRAPTRPVRNRRLSADVTLPPPPAPLRPTPLEPSGVGAEPPAPNVQPARPPNPVPRTQYTDAVEQITMDRELRVRNYDAHFFYGSQLRSIEAQIVSGHQELGFQICRYWLSQPGITPAMRAYLNHLLIQGNERMVHHAEEAIRLYRLVLRETSRPSPSYTQLEARIADCENKREIVRSCQSHQEAKRVLEHCKEISKLVLKIQDREEDMEIELLTMEESLEFFGDIMESVKQGFTEEQEMHWVRATRASIMRLSVEEEDSSWFTNAFQTNFFFFLMGDDAYLEWYMRDPENREYILLGLQAAETQEMDFAARYAKNDRAKDTRLWWDRSTARFKPRHELVGNHPHDPYDDGIKPYFRDELRGAARNSIALGIYDLSEGPLNGEVQPAFLAHMRVPKKYTWVRSISRETRGEMNKRMKAQRGIDSHRHSDTLEETVVREEGH